MWGEEDVPGERERKSVIGEQRWPRSPRIPPTRPDRIKLLEDDRKYIEKVRTRAVVLEKKGRARGGKTRTSVSRTRKP